jgi:hypothetical protein
MGLASYPIECFRPNIVVSFFVVHEQVVHDQVVYDQVHYLLMHYLLGDPVELYSPT